MALTNHERLTKALLLLKEGLRPFAERELLQVYGEDWREQVATLISDTRVIPDRSALLDDLHVLLVVMDRCYREVFSRTLGKMERSLVNELLAARNKWAHQGAFSSDDTYRALDSAERLLRSVSAYQADNLLQMKQELNRQVYDEQVRNEKKRVGGSLIEMAASGGLRPWREVVSPHPDVASGKYQQAEFAADLGQVALGQGSSEYRDPVEFFRRTYLTQSLRELLLTAIDRVRGEGGDPVVQLQTNFGGGKTHSMLALYHLFSGAKPSDLLGVEALLAQRKVSSLPQVRRVVLVGNKISPGNPSRKPDGTVVRTLWGELAYQLGGREAYERIALDDERATNPGDALRELFVSYGPCLILVDEWVAYARQLHDSAELPGGSFETQFTFAQALTEAAKLAPNCLLVVSLPASDTNAESEDVEVGGLRGREALQRLRNVVGRVESAWRPATADEGFEIVRRRLFQPLEGDAYKIRDVTAKAFSELYHKHSSEFPAECRTRDYEDRIKAAYPIHPEVFDRLYTDWSTLVKFQRTRGVLRLMAAVVHSLWQEDDKGPLILPSSIPIDEQRVQSELTRYLSDVWIPIIAKDVDGPDSLPNKIDGEVVNLGKLSATRRVARTVYLGSAPTAGLPHRGLEDNRVRLGCVLPHESPAVFGDALRRLAAAATYLYQDGPRVWYDTQPTVTKLAEDRAEQLKREPDRVTEELENRLRENLRDAGGFRRVHVCPRTASDVPDDLDAALVVLNATHAHSKEHSAAIAASQTLLESRGSAPRLYRNTLVFLAADKARLPDLEASIRLYLAWKSIKLDSQGLNLTPQQIQQAEGQLRSSEGRMLAQLPETYCWLITPQQDQPQSPVEWQSTRLSGSDPLAVRVSKRLRSDELLLSSIGPTVLRGYMDRVPLWRQDSVMVRQLLQDFASYLYLPRLREPDVLLRAIEDALALLTWNLEGFALADSQENGRFRGLRVGSGPYGLSRDSSFLLVKPDIAQLQLEEGSPVTQEAKSPQPDAAGLGSGALQGSPIPPARPSRTKKRFHGKAVLDPVRASRDVAKIAEEVLAHLTALEGVQVEVVLEIQASVEGGVPDQVIRIVSENARALRFQNHGFEED